MGKFIEWLFPNVAPRASRDKEEGFESVLPFPAALSPDDMIEIEADDVTLRVRHYADGTIDVLLRKKNRDD